MSSIPDDAMAVAARTGRSLALLVLSLVAATHAHWLDDPRYPDWAQRGRIIYLDATRATEDHLSLAERYKAEGATPFIHAFTPHWPDDEKVVARLAKAGIPVDVRVEGSLFFEDDHIDRFAFIHGKFLPGGWWFNHAWRTNYDWWRVFPESARATTRKRNGDEKLGYAGHRVVVRREGSPIAPEHRSARAKQIAWLLAGADPLPDVPMRPYENLHAKDPKVPYPMLGSYSELWYDNPSSQPSYDVASRTAWEKHFTTKFGVELWDPASHPDPNVRREWARFWGEAWADYYLWRKGFQDKLLRERGKPVCLTAGNFSFVSQPHGTAEFYLGKRGVVDMLGPSEYVPEFCRGRFHFLIKAAMAVTHGRPAGKFYPNDMQAAESLALGGCNTYRPEQAEFLVANVDLFERVQPGGRIAILYHAEHELVESRLVDFIELADQITALGFPYEVVCEDDLELGAALAKQVPLLVLSQTDLTEGQAARLGEYVKGGGNVLLIGDCLIEGPRYYDLRKPPAWTPDRPVAAALAAGDVLLFPARGDAAAHSGTGGGRVGKAESPLPPAALRRAIEALGGIPSGFRLDPPDPDLLLSILRQREGEAPAEPKGALTLVGLVNYSGKLKANVAVRVPAELAALHAGWISRDGGAGPLSLQDGRLVVPELRYGCTIILGKDSAAIERIVDRNAKRFPRQPMAADFKWVRAMEYGGWRARQLPADAVPESQQLCRHRVGATDRGGYLFLDILAPRSARVGEGARFDLHVLDTRYDHVEYWQLILEDTATGQRTVVPIPLPAANPYGEAGKLRGTTLTAAWTPSKAGSYQPFLAYRVTRVSHDGEPFTEPESVAAGYSGSTPANLFLRSQPLLKRPCEDRLRGLAIRVE